MELQRRGSRANDRECCPTLEIPNGELASNARRCRTRRCKAGRKRGEAREEVNSEERKQKRRWLGMRDLGKHETSGNPRRCLVEEHSFGGRERSSRAK